MKNALYVSKHFNSILNHKAESLNNVKLSHIVIFRRSDYFYYTKIVKSVNNKINYYLVAYE